MTTIKSVYLVMRIFAIALIATGCQETTGTYDSLNTKTVYYAIEMNGTLCGYAEVTQESVKEDGKTYLHQVNHTEMEMSIMERSVSTRINMTCSVDSVSGRVNWQEVDIRQGKVHIEGSTTFMDNQAIQESPDSEEPRVVDMPEGYVTDNFLSYPYLYEDFILNGKNSGRYSILNPLRGIVMDKEYTLKGYDTVFLAGDYHPAMVLNEKIPSMGGHSTVWISMKDGMILKDEMKDGSRTKYLADHRIKDMIAMVDLDNVIFYKVGKVINDFKGLKYTRIEAKINTVGDSVTFETLNFPGQRFTGKVEEGNIDGVFEIQPVRYDGADAPGFPPDPASIKDVAEYLEPSEFIESDDDGIRRKAKQITEDASDSWEAAKMLSSWVNKNIGGAIPGGGTAKGTLKEREAECGGHSRLLAAFCRSVGIPSRMVMGCMYVPDHGGFFGQHAWTEVWMGEAGWIPVDATIGEIDYVDAGHIRLGERAVFHPEYMNIEEYRIKL
jgi:hypothetical protein